MSLTRSYRVKKAPAKKVAAPKKPPARSAATKKKPETIALTDSDESEDEPVRKRKR